MKSVQVSGFEPPVVDAGLKPLPGENFLAALLSVRRGGHDDGQRVSRIVAAFAVAIPGDALGKPDGEAYEICGQASKVADGIWSVQIMAVGRANVPQQTLPG